MITTYIRRGGTMMIKKTSTFSIIFYALSILVLAYVVWAFTYSYQTVSDAIAAGQLVAKDNQFEIVNYYVTNCGQYFIFALLLFAAGWIGRESTVVTNDVEVVVENNEVVETEEVQPAKQQEEQKEEQQYDEKVKVEAVKVESKL
jgi:hypothetical protein